MWDLRKVSENELGRAYVRTLFSDEPVSQRNVSRLEKKIAEGDAKRTWRKASFCPNTHKLSEWL